MVWPKKETPISVCDTFCFRFSYPVVEQKGCVRNQTSNCQEWPNGFNVRVIAKVRIKVSPKGMTQKSGKEKKSKDSKTNTVKAKSRDRIKTKVKLKTKTSKR